MILGIGLDLCEIERLKRAIARERFVDRVYTPAEGQRIREACESRAAEIAAGLFAAKEAVAKALGTGFAGFGPGDIEITPDIAGRPVCVLREGALKRAQALAAPGEVRIWVSVTHDSGMAAATAIIEREER